MTEQLNQFGRIQSVPFSNRLVITAECVAALTNLPVGSGLLVEGRLVGQPGTPGQVLMLASSVVPLGRLPGTQTAGKFRAEVGFNQATWRPRLRPNSSRAAYNAPPSPSSSTTGATLCVVTESHLTRPTLAPVNPATAPATQKAAKR